MLGEVLVGKLPVDKAPPGFQVLGTSISVVNVVSMLPNIASQERGKLVVLDDCVSIMGVNNLDLFGLLVQHQPGPSASKVASSLLAELLQNKMLVTSAFVLFVAFNKEII